MYRGVLLAVLLFGLLAAVPVAAHTNALSADSQLSTNGTVRIERLITVSRSFVVLHADANGTPGAVVGHRRLTAGLHRNVTVPIDEAFYADRPEQFALWATVHRSDGDGSFDAGSDGAITAAGSPVGSRFEVERTGNRTANGEHHDHGDDEHTESATSSPSPSPTATPSPEPTAAPSPAATATATPRPTPTPSRTPRRTATSATARSGGDEPTATATNSPGDAAAAGETPGAAGFGIPVSVTAVASLLAVRSWRQRARGE